MLFNYQFCVLLLFIYSLNSEGALQSNAISELLTETDAFYRRGEDTIISDACYDELYLRYLSNNEDFKPHNQKSHKTKFLHKKAVLSLKKAYTDEELYSFIEKFEDETYFLIEAKVDGVSLVLHYRKGRLALALTRGNTLSGLDVTNVIEHLHCVPMRIQDESDLLLVRGELYMNESDFISYNSKNKVRGFSSARSLVAGSLMLKDLNALEGRKIRFLAFNLMNAGELGIGKDEDALHYLKRLKLPVIDYKIRNNKKDILNEINVIWEQRSCLDYRIDGVVVKVSDLVKREEIGETKKYPNWALARKFRSASVETFVKEIEWKISDRGRRTPIAILEEVSIGDLRVSRASLHTEKFMQALDIKVGSRVEVICAGGVIPEIVAVLE